MTNRYNPPKTPLDLDDYRGLVHLDEPFVPPEPAPEDPASREAIVDGLLVYLKAEPGFRDEEIAAGSYAEKRRTLKGWLTVRPPSPLPDTFNHDMDRLLQRERLERAATTAAGLPTAAEKWPESSYPAVQLCSVWRGDITTLAVDAIVNAANEYLLGCRLPFHACIDNAIHCAAGPRLREDCDLIVRVQNSLEGTGWAKLTRGYNLPARFVLHTVGPIVRGPAPQPEQADELASCYRACLDTAACCTGIRSVAFCCISTGVFGYPQEDAARVALQAVADWLSLHPGALDRVIFNVFTAADEAIYTRLLNQ